MDPINPWQQQALAHWEMINRMAGRRFAQAVLAEQAALFVMDRLADDDWRRLRAFSGRSTLSTYIGALTLRLLEDFARSRLGRRTPPRWIRRLGGIWMTLFRLLCVERYSLDEAVAIITAQQASDSRTVEESAYQLLAELPSCGEHRGEQVSLDEATLTPPDLHDCSAQEHRVQQGERDQLFAILGRMLFDEAGTEGDPRLLVRVAEAGILLEPRERLLLKLCYRDGLAVAEAGRMLGWNRHQVHGRLRRLLQRLRQDFVDAGLEDELRLLLQEDTTHPGNRYRLTS